MTSGTSNNTRRSFLKDTLALGVIAAAAPQRSHAASYPNKRDEEGAGLTFVFRGDSITDGNRSRNSDRNHVMRHGCQYILASKLWYDFPKKDLHFFNRGISGNKVTDLIARWQPDTLDLQPNVLSMLIGINDTSAWIRGDKSFTAAQYESGYRSLLQQTKAQLPDVQSVLCEPFIFPVGGGKRKLGGICGGSGKKAEDSCRAGNGYKAV